MDTTTPRPYPLALMSSTGDSMHHRPQSLILRTLAFALCMSGTGVALAQADPADGEAALGLETCELVVPGTPLSTTGQCGWLEVAENPADPDGRQIRIRVARIPARDRVVEPDPLVFFAGGPGQAATETWPLVAHALRKVNKNRDILLVDQRGTGQSNPLKCPEIEVEEALAADWDELARATRECLASLDGDPRYYTTTVAMHDIDAARAALGYDTVNLYGGSYGTRAAQVYLRLFPDRVRTVVLDSVVPQSLALGTEHAAKLDQALYRVLDGCDADPDCGKAFPATAEKLAALARNLQDNPVEVTIEHPTTGQPMTFTFDRDVLSSALRFLSYSSDTQAMLPLLIHEAARENRFDRLASQMLIATAGLQQSISQGMEMSVMCAEDYPWYAQNRVEGDFLMGDLLTRAADVQCGIWPRGEVPDGFHEPVTVDVPVLLLSGELDPVTPPEYGDRVAAHFPDAMHLVARGQGHIVTTRGCMGDVVSEFIIAGSSAELDTTCLEQLGHAPYFLSLTGPAP
jgi:pimeloyl-ACP methyl ester carboxylesterase